MKQQGFSMIEIIVVLSVLAILLAITMPNYRHWRASVQVRQAAVQLSQDISKQRSEARRSSTAKDVSFGSNSYTVSGNTIPMPSNITLEPVGSTSALQFFPPYGTFGEPLRTFKLRWASDTSIERTVRVVGVMGKVIVQ